MKPNPAATAPTLNRERTALLRDVQTGKVYRSMGGCDLRMVRAGQNRRVDRKLRELRQAGWVELADDDRSYRLTDEGRAALDRYEDPATLGARP